MLIEKLKKWKNPSAILNEPIKHCKICFKPFKSSTFYEFFHGDSLICSECKKKFVPRFHTFDLDGIDGVAIYDYDDNIKSLLYQLKGCYDIELAPIFLNDFKKELSIFYSSYILVPSPSYYLDDENRGFNHVEEMFKTLNLPFSKIIHKISPFKQAEHKRKERKQISKHLVLDKQNDIVGKNILIVDDVFTTGTTLKTMVNLVRDCHPKTIKILVISKRTL